MTLISGSVICTVRQMLAVISVVLAIAYAGACNALTNDEIMQRVHERDRGDKVLSSMTMLLINAKGETRERTIESTTLEVGEDTYTLSTFIHPGSLEGIKFLSYDYEDYDTSDDQWIYLPELKKKKRIASSNKSSSFFGSDFSYADMTKMPIKNYSFTLLGEKLIGEDPHWEIAALPNRKEMDRTGYKKVTLFVNKANYVVSREIIVLKNGSKKYFSATDWTNYDGVWFAHHIDMVSVRGSVIQHKTQLNFYNVSFNNAAIVRDLFNPGLLSQ